MFRYFSIHTKENISQERLVFLIKIIGEHYSHEFSSSNSNKKNGILKVHKELSRDRFYVTKTQIKTFLYPNKNSTIKHLFGTNNQINTLKIPYSAFKIFEKIIDIVLNNKTLSDKCNKMFMKDKDTGKCLCRDTIIGDFFEVLDFRSRYLIGKQKNLYKMFRQICDKTCKY